MSRSKLFFLILSLIFMFSSFSVKSQESENSKENKLHHRAAIIFSHSQVPAINGEAEKSKPFLLLRLGLTMSYVLTAGGLLVCIGHFFRDQETSLQIIKTSPSSKQELNTAYP